MPRQAQKYVARSARPVGGGGAANAAVAIARLGGHARLAARVGDDVMGEMVLSQLRSASVDCSLVQQSTDASSSFSSVLVDASGERQIVNYRGNNLSDDASFINNLTVDCVLADTRWQAGTVAAMQLARRLGVPAVLDGEAPVALETMQYASHIAFSMQGLTDLTGESDVQRALRAVADQSNAWLCVTDGENGVTVFSEDKLVTVAAPEVNVVDTLGAGDVWHGAFALQLAQGLDELQAIEFANAAASLKCTRRGGGRAGPDLAEVNAFINRLAVQ
ncbi:hypothetical protein AB833_20005 [Chromatiales bacterium (ex Bugula neritina AB1)]|nr:hypothetical protein AB833_20005 [Chromatiales bacterium (ex Bugula neritina AB1)]